LVVIRISHFFFNSMFPQSITRYPIYIILKFHNLTLPNYHFLCRNSKHRCSLHFTIVPPPDLSHGEDGLSSLPEGEKGFSPMQKSNFLHSWDFNPQFCAFHMIYRDLSLPKILFPGDPISMSISTTLGPPEPLHDLQRRFVFDAESAP